MSLSQLINSLELERTWPGWLVGGAIAAPGAAYAALALLKALHGGWRLVPPRCPRCRHQQRTATIELPERCLECGRPLMGGVPWVRRARSARVFAGWTLVSIVTLALGIGIGGWVFAIVVAPRAQFGSSNRLDELLDGASGPRGILRGLEMWAERAEEAPPAPDAPRLNLVVACLERDGRTGPIAHWMQGEGLGAALEAPLALATLVQHGAIGATDALRVIELLGIAPRFRLGASAAPGARYVIGWTSAQGMAVDVDEVTIDGVPSAVERFGTGAVVTLPGRAGTARVEVVGRLRIHPVSNAADVADEPVEIARLRRRVDVIVSPDAPRPPPLVVEGWRPFVGLSPTPTVEVRRIGLRVVAAVTLPARAPGIVVNGDWTIEADGRSAPLLAVDPWYRPLQALFPCDDGTAPLPGRATIRFVPTTRSDPSASEATCAWPDPIEWIDVPATAKR